MTQPKITTLGLREKQHAAPITIITNYSQTILNMLTYKAETEIFHPSKVDFLYLESCCLAYFAMLLYHFVQVEKQG